MLINIINNLPMHLRTTVESIWAFLIEGWQSLVEEHQEDGAVVIFNNEEILEILNQNIEDNAQGDNDNILPAINDDVDDPDVVPDPIDPEPVNIVPPMDGDVPELVVEPTNGANPQDGLDATNQNQPIIDDPMEMLLGEHLIDDVNIMLLNIDDVHEPIAMSIEDNPQDAGIEHEENTPEDIDPRPLRMFLDEAQNFIDIANDALFMGAD